MENAPHMTPMQAIVASLGAIVFTMFLIGYIVATMPKSRVFVEQTFPKILAVFF